jgi:hypothetical protein
VHVFTQVVHLALIDDVLRVVDLSPEVSLDFKGVLQQERELAEIGVISRLPAFIRLFERIRDGWADRNPEELVEKKLAYIAGCLLNKAVAEAIPSSPDDRNGALSRDAFVFREIAGRGGDDDLSPADVEVFLKVLAIRGIIALHTFQPGLDGGDWAERLLRLWEDFYAELPRFSQALVAPNPDHVARYVVDANFYDPDDALIQLLRRVQRGQPVDWEAVATALQGVAAQSVYARSVKAGYDALVAADRFFHARISTRQLLDVVGTQ